MGFFLKGDFRYGWSRVPETPSMRKLLELKSSEMGFLAI